MVNMYHSILIHSSADGHLGCFHVLAIINMHWVFVAVQGLLSSCSAQGSLIAEDGI